MGVLLFLCSVAFVHADDHASAEAAAPASGEPAAAAAVPPAPAPSPSREADLLSRPWPASLKEGYMVKLGSLHQYSSGTAQAKADLALSKVIGQGRIGNLDDMVELLQGDPARTFSTVAAASQYFQNTLYPDDAARHVFSCAVDDALLLLESDIRAVAEAWEGRGNLREAANATGRAMHTVMDFYGYSDWIEEQAGAPVLVAIWTPEGQRAARGHSSHHRPTAQPDRCAGARPDLDKTRPTGHGSLLHPVTGRTLHAEADALASQAVLEFARWLLTERVPSLGAHLQKRMVFFPAVAQAHEMDVP